MVLQFHDNQICQWLYLHSSYVDSKDFKQLKLNIQLQCIATIVVEVLRCGSCKALGQKQINKQFQNSLCIVFSRK
jgi:hypothetical protein